MKEGGRGRAEGGGSIFHFLVHFSNCCSIQGWTKPKPGARNYPQISHVDGRDLSIWTIIYCLPGALAGSCIGIRRRTPTQALWYRIQVTHGATKPIVLPCPPHLGWIYDNDRMTARPGPMAGCSLFPGDGLLCHLHEANWPMWVLNP